jgi:CheY-like chemotaxis protein
MRARPMDARRMTDALLSDIVLVVEDDIIIAMEAEQILLSLGASECEITGKAGAACELVRRRKPGFVLLDVNLGSEDSEPVARLLLELGIPFVVASGYGETDARHVALASAPSVAKPYTQVEIVAAIRRALASRDR